MKPTRCAQWIAPVAAVLFAASAAHAGPGVVDERVEGNVLEARIEIGGVRFAGLRVEFEEVSGLEPGGLGLSAELLGPQALAALAARLPDPLRTSVPVQLPILLRIDPEPGLRMRGVAFLSLHTDLVHFSPGTRLRLYAAPPGGRFVDVTSEAGAGSYRGGAVRPDFTGDVVFGSDQRPDEEITREHLNALDGLLRQHGAAIAADVLAELQEQAGAVRSEVEGGDPAGALSALDELVATVEAAAGDGIPDVWEAAGFLANAAGGLRSQAAALQYSLLQLVPGL